MRELIYELPISQLDLVLDEILHSVVLTKISQFSQPLFSFHDCITILKLFFKLNLSISFFLDLLHFREYKHLKVDRLLALFLPLAHLRPDLGQLILQLRLLLPMDHIYKIQHFPFHILLFRANQILNVILMPNFSFLRSLPMPSCIYGGKNWRFQNLIGRLVLFLIQLRNIV